MALEANEASWRGGALSLYGPTTIDSCDFIGNNIRNNDSGGDSYGGAIWIQSAAAFEVVDSTFQGNYVRTDDYCHGGAIYAESGSFVGIFTNCIFDGNLADGEEHQNTERGGAVYLKSGASPEDEGLYVLHHQHWVEEMLRAIDKERSQFIATAPAS